MNLRMSHKQRMYLQRAPLKSSARGIEMILVDELLLFTSGGLPYTKPIVGRYCAVVLTRSIKSEHEQHFRSWCLNRDKCEISSQCQLKDFVSTMSQRALSS